MKMSFYCWVIFYFQFKLFLFINRNYHINGRNIYNTTFIPIHGNNSLGEHYIDVFIGNNRQKQSLLIDITSYLTSLLCEDICIDCKDSNKTMYKLSNSSSVIRCEEEKCGFLNSNCDDEENEQCTYNVNNMNGVYIEDYFLFQNTSYLKDHSYNDTKFLFGCNSHNVLEYEKKNYSGVLGLGADLDSFIPVYLAMNPNLTNIDGFFSICYDKKEGGYFNVDNIDSSYHNEFDEITFFSYNDKNSAYQFKLSSITLLNSLNNKLFDLQVSNLMIASLTNDYYTSFPPSLYDNFKDILNNYLSLFEIDAKIETDEKSSLLIVNTNTVYDILVYYLPTISFSIPIDQISLGKFKWNPQSYLSYNNYTIYINIKQSSDEYTISLGSSWMSDHEIIFNFNEKKIGFIESNCNMIRIDGCNSPYNPYLRMVHSIFIPIVIALLVIMIMLIVAVKELRRENSFMCFKSRKDQLDEINMEMIPSNYSLISI